MATLDRTLGHAYNGGFVPLRNSFQRRGLRHCSPGFLEFEVSKGNNGGACTQFGSRKAIAACSGTSVQWHKRVVAQAGSGTGVSPVMRPRRATPASCRKEPNSTCQRACPQWDRYMYNCIKLPRPFPPTFRTSAVHFLGILIRTHRLEWRRKDRVCFGVFGAMGGFEATGNGVGRFGGRREIVRIGLVGDNVQSGQKSRSGRDLRKWPLT